MPAITELAPGTPDGVAAIILAAGRSTRMRSKIPKPLHPICGVPLTEHVIRSCRAAGVSRIIVVVGHEADLVREGLGQNIEYAVQESPRGTGDAVRSARAVFDGWSGIILVLAGDVPLLPPETIKRLIDRQRGARPAVTMLTATLDDPSGYGRITRNPGGSITGIVEHKDATTDQQAIREWNPSIYAFDSAALWSSLNQIQAANAQGEYYLTDTISILHREGNVIESVRADSSNDVLGVNNRVELAGAAAILRQRIMREHMLSGVSITDPACTYIEADVEIGQDTIIEPNTFIHTGTHIGEECVIGPMARVLKSSIGNRTKIWYSQAVEATIGSDVSVGPFANLRPGTRLQDRVKIGDFVEVKNAEFGAGAQASHLSYVGDAEIGAGTNLGAGTITCNYDGYRKLRTIIGKNVFVGSQSTLVAPITVGDGAFIAAGSTVTVNVPSDAMAIARTRPTLKEGWAASYRAERGKKSSAEPPGGTNEARG